MEEVKYKYGKLKFISTKELVTAVSTGRKYFKYDFRIIDNNKLIYNDKNQDKVYDKFMKLYREKRVKDGLGEFKDEEVLDLHANCRRLKDLINYRLDNIHSITVEDYTVVKNMILLARLYEVDDEFINSIKIRYKHFNL